MLRIRRFASTPRPERGTYDTTAMAVASARTNAQCYHRPRVDPSIVERRYASRVGEDVHAERSRGEPAGVTETVGGR
jgi:hypothetical protein